MTTKPTWAIIGTGKISRSMIADLRAIGAEVRMVHSRSAENAERFAQEFAIPHHTDSYGQVLADPAVDILYVATPFTSHFALTREAIGAGKHVLVEKPMATSAREARELFDLAREHRVFLMEGMWMKFNPAFRRLKTELAAGRIGDPRSLRAGFCMPMPEGGSRWSLDGSPGALLDQGIYPVTLAHALFGVPTSIRAAGRLREDGLDLAEHFSFEYADGRWATGASSMVELGESSAAISGTQGWIELPGMFWANTSLEIHADSWDQIIANPLRIDLDREGNGYVPMLREVTDAILAGVLEHPVHTADDTIAVFGTLDEIRRQLELASAARRGE